MTETRIEYVKRHYELRKVRGKASDQLCVRCLEDGVEKRARDWAHLHTEDGTDPWADYVPLCRSCHMRYDKLGSKVSAHLKGRAWSAEIREAHEKPRSRQKPEVHGNTGKPKPPEVRAKISAAKQGIKPSDETRAKMSASQKGHAGHPHSEETKAKMRAAQLGKPKSPEHRAKLSAAAKNRRKKGTESI